MKRPPHRLDWNDREAVREWWRALLAAYEDVAAVADDLVKPYRKRKLGPAAARKLYRDADKSVRSLVSYGDPLLAERGDPAGNGGAGPVA
jgi:hypothetical protein